MYKSVFITTAALTLIFIIAPSTARAQEHDAPKVEVGAQFSSLSVTPPNTFGTENATGFGGRVTYNLNDHVAVEAEGNFYPTTQSNTYVTGGRAEQVQFGLKFGKRFDKFGVFAKVRPGFISFGEALRVTQTPLAPGGFDIVNTFTQERKTHFTTDVGGVLELYPTRRVLVRFDFGDTMIRYGAHDEAGPTFLGSPDTIFKAPAEIKHNFQFTGGVSYRFGGGADKADDAQSYKPSDSKRRFEVGVQFSSFALNLSSSDFGFPVFAPFDTGNHTEAGFGGRVGYNFTDNFALEAEGNYYPRSSRANSSTGGFPVQFQFGPKFGKRYRRFGVFAKARPGLITFSRVLHQTGTETFTFGSQTFVFPVFEDRRRTYFSADLGGVLEFYPSSRIVTRFDFGDTLIHYGRRDAQGLITTSPPTTIAPSTTHNFQFTAGIGLRF
jgi:Outer membrane protein beta-barrel domain